MAGRRKQLTYFEEQLLGELRELRLAIADLSTNNGKWLSAIATAAANPADNSEEVRRTLGEIAAELKGEADALEASAKEATNNQGE